LCSGTTTTYQSPGTGGVTYNWTVIGAKINTSGQSVNVTWGTTATGLIKLRATSSNGCIDSSNKPIVINAKSKATILTDSIACEGQAETFKANKVSGYKYDWKSTGTPSFVNNTDTLVSIFTNLTGQNVQLKVTDTKGCKDSILAQIAVRRKPKGSFVYTTTSPVLSYNFAATDSTLSKYNWDFGDKNTSNLGFKVKHTYSTAKVYTVKLNVTDANGCMGIDSQTIFLTYIDGKQQSIGLKVYPNPAVNMLSLEFEKQLTHIQVEMIDMMGRVIQQENNFAGTLLKFDVNTLPKGMYQIRLMDSNTHKATQIPFIKN
jgi:hypothetical protein